MRKRYIKLVNHDENITFDAKIKTQWPYQNELMFVEEKSKADLLLVFYELVNESEL